MMVLTELNDEVSFREEVLKKGSPTLVAFIQTDDDRGLTVLERVAEENEGKVKFCMAKASELTETVKSLGLTRFPSFVMFKDGEVVEKTMGPAPRQILQVMLSKHV